MRRRLYSKRKVKLNQVSPVNTRTDVSRGVRAIGTASTNSVEFRGIRPRMYIEGLLLKRDADVT